MPLSSSIDPIKPLMKILPAIYDKIIVSYDRLNELNCSVNMLLFLTLGILVLSIILNILRVYFLRKRGYFLSHKTKKYDKFERELNDILNR